MWRAGWVLNKTMANNVLRTNKWKASDLLSLSLKKDQIRIMKPKWKSFINFQRLTKLNNNIDFNLEYPEYQKWPKKSNHSLQIIKYFTPCDTFACEKDIIYSGVTFQISVKIKHLIPRTNALAEFFSIVKRGYPAFILHLHTLSIKWFHQINAWSNFIANTFFRVF